MTKSTKDDWSFALEHFISDCVVRHANNSEFTAKGKTYRFTTRYGRFSVPFFSVACDQTEFSVEINGNHQHHNRLIDSIIEEMKNNNGE